MKSNRILQLVLLVLVIVFVAAAGFLYTANSSEIKRHTQLTDTLNKDQVTYNNGLVQQAALQKTAADLASQLAAAKASLANSHFRSSAESIEYDNILYSIADGVKLQVTSLTAGSPSNVQEKDTTYQVTTFTVSVKGLSPDGIFSATADDTTYIASVVDNILTFENKIATGTDFDTAVIQSVNISEPSPMTATDIQTEIDGINNKIAAGLKDAITALTAQIQKDNAGKLTPDQIAALVKSETDALIATTLASQTPEQIKALVEQANIAAPTAVITIDVWTCKGA
jgi:hypothetical protein